MSKRKKLHRLPAWIRSQDFRLLNRSQKDFLGYLYCFGPDTCWLWNWRLAKKFPRHQTHDSPMAQGTQGEPIHLD